MSRRKRKKVRFAVDGADDADDADDSADADAVADAEVQMLTASENTSKVSRGVRSSAPPQGETKSGGKESDSDDEKLETFTHARPDVLSGRRMAAIRRPLARSPSSSPQRAIATIHSPLLNSPSAPSPSSSSSSSSSTGLTPFMAKMHITKKRKRDGRGGTKRKRRNKSRKKPRKKHRKKSRKKPRKKSRKKHRKKSRKRRKKV